MLFLFLFILSSCLISQNFNYHDDDWFTLSNPGIITSLTSTNDKIIFTSENGVYSFDKYTSELMFLDDFTRNFSTAIYQLIHYDRYRDFLWILTDENISYKPYMSSFWREIDFYEINLNSHYNILNIGSNHEYLFLNIGSEILILNPHTGALINIDNYNFSNVNWTNSNRYVVDKNIDLTNFHSLEGYNIISNDQIEFNGMNIRITSFIVDGNQIWLGTDSGQLFVCDSNLNIFEKIKSIPQFTDINLTYLDNYEEWWLTNNDMIFVSNSIFIGNNQIFLTRWIQNENNWNHYYQNKYSHIKSKDITSIFRYNNLVYLGTRYGLLIFEILKNSWTLLNEKKGMKNQYITDLDFYNNRLFISTNSGIELLNINDNVLLENVELNVFENKLVYDIDIIDNNLFLIADNNFYKYDLSHNKVDNYFNGRYYIMEVDSMKNIILASNRKIERLINDEIELIGYFDSIGEISVCNDNYLWINSNNKIIFVDLLLNEKFEYNSNDGIPGDEINDIGCDDFWVWFSTNKGLSFYNWRKYHNEKK